MGDLDFVFLGQLVHTQDSDDVLERLVILEKLLDSTGDAVVLVSDDVGVHDTGSGIEGIHGGGDSTLGDTSGQDSGGVKMREGGGGGRISQVVSGHVDSLYGGDGTLLGGGDPFLHSTHVSGQGGLVTDSGGDTTEQGRHFGTGLGEAENVVDKEQHVLSFFVSEVFGNGESGEADTSTGAWGLVHLA